jgi:hypothetical protein
MTKGECLRTATFEFSQALAAYIPFGTSFDDAEDILRHAGFRIYSQRQRNLGRLPDARQEYKTKATLDRNTFWPMRALTALVILNPTEPADFSRVGQFRVYLLKTTWWHKLVEAV